MSRSSARSTAGWELALRYPNREYTHKGLKAMNSLDAWRRRYIEQYGPCEEPQLTRQAEILRHKELSERGRKGGRAGRK